MKAKKVLLGCGIGCGALIVLAVVFAVSFAIWVNQPGELLEPSTLLSEDATGYVEVELKAEDPGTRALMAAMTDFLEVSQKHQNRAFPGWLRPWMQQIQKRQNQTKEIEMLLPATAGLTLRRDAPDSDLLVVGSISVVRLGNRLRLLDWFMGFTVPDSAEHGDERIYGLGEGEERLYLFLRGSDAYFSNDIFAAKRTIDEFIVPAEPAPDSALPVLLDEIPTDRIVRGAIVDQEWLAETFELDPEQSLELVGCTIDGNFSDAGDAELQLKLRSAGSAWTEESAAEFREIVESWASGSEFETEITHRIDGLDLVIDVRIPELLERVLDEFEATLDRVDTSRRRNR